MRRRKKEIKYKARKYRDSAEGETAESRFGFFYFILKAILCRFFLLVYVVRFEDKCNGGKIIHPSAGRVRPNLFSKKMEEKTVCVWPPPIGDIIDEESSFLGLANWLVRSVDWRTFFFSFFCAADSSLLCLVWSPDFYNRTGSQTDRRTDRHTDRQTDRQS